VSADQVDAIGHWQSNTRREIYAAKIPKMVFPFHIFLRAFQCLSTWDQQAVTALAGFSVGEQYHVPWAEVDVPKELQIKLFPFVEGALADMKASTHINQGTINSLELLQQLRPFFWRVRASDLNLSPSSAECCTLTFWSARQVVAAIQNKYPSSPICSKLTIVKCDGAAEFVATWPAALEAKTKELAPEIALQAAFSEAATQSAFWAIASRQQQMQTMLTTTHAQLQVLERRTEPLSPSAKKKSAHTPSTQLEPHVSVHHHPNVPCHCGHICPPAGPSNTSASLPQIPYGSVPLAASIPTSMPLMSTPAAPPSLPAPSGPPGQPHAGMAMSPRNPSMSPRGPGTPTQAHTIPSHPPHPPPAATTPQEIGLIPPRTFPVIPITTGAKTYNVLVLSGPSGVHNPVSDLVLPSAHAFCEASPASASYPTFRAANCSWLSIFELVQQPKLLWDSYAPHNLGEYPDISSLWLAWSEGGFLEGVGRLPSLQLVDRRWGSQKNEKHKGRQPEWRPVKNARVRLRLCILACTFVC
jgi:hypothetical protein